MRETNDLADWRKRHRRRLVVVVVLLGLAGLSVGLLAWGPWRSRSERLFDEALPLISRNPAEAERLLKFAVTDVDEPCPDALLALAQLQGRKKNWNEAHDLVAKTTLENCQTPLLAQLGREACTDRQWALAEPLLEEVLRRPDSNERETLALLRSVYQQLSKFGDLLDVTKRLVQLTPNDSKVLWGLGRLQEEMGLRDDAIATYRKVLETEMPFDVRLPMHQRMMELILESGDLAAARVELQQILSDHGQSAELRYYDAEICRQEGRRSDAMTAVERCLADGYRSNQAYLLRGLLHHESGEMEPAATDFRTVILRDPFVEMAHFKLADCYRRLGREDEATRHQAEYDRIRKIRLEILELKKQLRNYPDNRASRERLRRLNDSITVPSGINQGKRIRDTEA